MKHSIITLAAALCKISQNSFWLVSSPQFPDVVAFAEMMADYGKTVIIAALDGTFQRQVRQ